MKPRTRLTPDQIGALKHMAMTDAPLIVERGHPCRRRARFAGRGPRISVRAADGLIAAGLIEPDPKRPQPDWCGYYRLTEAGRRHGEELDP